VGTGKDVWEIIAAYETTTVTPPRRHAILSWPLGLVQAAISYYGAYRDEIDQWIEANDSK